MVTEWQLLCSILFGLTVAPITTECKLEKSEDHFIWLGSYQYHHIKTMKSLWCCYYYETIVFTDLCHHVNCKEREASSDLQPPFSVLILRIIKKKSFPRNVQPVNLFFASKYTWYSCSSGKEAGLHEGVKIHNKSELKVESCEKSAFLPALWL